MCHPEHYRLLQMIIILHAHWEGGTLVPVTDGERIDDYRLRQATHGRGDRLAENERGPGRRADQVAVEHAEIAFPDRRDAIENRGEEDALR